MVTEGWKQYAIGWELRKWLLFWMRGGEGNRGLSIRKIVDRITGFTGLTVSTKIDNKESRKILSEYYLTFSLQIPG